MKTTTVLTVLSILLAAVGHAFAAVRYVNVNSSSATPPYTTWATAATAIQDAIDVAEAGDEIVVTNGVYETGGQTLVESLTSRVVVTKPLTVRSVNGPEVTVIRGYQVPGATNGDGAVRCVYLFADGATIAGFTLTNGAGREGGGLLCDSASCIASNCILVGNAAENGGGGAWRGTLNDCTLAGNSTLGFGFGGGAIASELSNCTISSNSAGGQGGGVYGGTLNRCTVSGNLASAGGGAASSTLKHCTLSFNLAAGFGGGTWASDLADCTIISNSASFGGGAGPRFQTEIGYTPVTLNNCSLIGNSALSGGGAWGNILNNCTLLWNSASVCGGGAFGGMYNCCGEDPPMLRNCACCQGSVGAFRVFEEEFFS
jgi:hypothetical protein